jgi:hypothetical protein
MTLAKFDIRVPTTVTELNHTRFFIVNTISIIMRLIWYAKKALPFSNPPPSHILLFISKGKTSL